MQQALDIMEFYEPIVMGMPIGKDNDNWVIDFIQVATNNGVDFTVEIWSLKGEKEELHLGLIKSAYKRFLIPYLNESGIEFKPEKFGLYF